jgi:hypothetical protein
VKKLLLPILVLCPSSVVAQPVLFDDFDGNALAPSWHQPNASRWQYNVTDGMLNVTALTYPSNPQSPSNGATMGSFFETQMDFRMDAWMGWDGGDSPEAIEFTPVSTTGSILATFGYRNDPNGGPRIFIEAGTLFTATATAPAPGIHHFALSRAGDQFEFFLNDVRVAAFPDTWRTPASIISISFGGPFPGELGTLHVDRVVVVPSPAAFVLIGLSALVAVRRRKLNL